MGPDDVAVVRMAGREQRLNHRLFGQSIGLVLDALTPFVADHVLLIRQRGLIDLLEQVPHPIGFEPEGELDLIGGHGLEVVRAVVIGGAVQVTRASGLEQPDVRVGRHVLRALKHHVLEEVREPGAPLVLVGGTDVIPEIDRHHRQAALGAENDLEPVRQRVLLELQTRNIGRRRGAAVLRERGRQARDREEQGHQNGNECSYVHDSHSSADLGRLQAAPTFTRCRDLPTDTSTRRNDRAASSRRAGSDEPALVRDAAYTLVGRL